MANEVLKWALEEVRDLVVTSDRRTRLRKIEEAAAKHEFLCVVRESAAAWFDEHIRTVRIRSVKKRE